MDGPTQTALLDPDVLDRLDVPAETAPEADARRGELAKRLAGYMTAAPPAPATETAAHEGCDCAAHVDEPDHEPCDACKLGTVVIVNGDDTAAPAAPTPSPDPADEVIEGGDGDAASPDDLVDVDPENPGRFRAVLITEGERTVDDRVVDPGACTWRDTPLPFMVMTETQPGHMGAEVGAVIEEIHREGFEIVATGRFDTGETGVEGARLVANRVLTGVSIDPGDVVVEYEVEEVDDDGFPIKVLEHYTSLVILGATICPFQAVTSAHVEYVAPENLAASGAPPEPRSLPLGTVAWEPPTADAAPLTEAEAEATVPDALTAGAGIVFSAALFDNPKFEEVSPLRVRPDGSFSGHLATFGECHVGIPGACIMAPRSRTGYAYFLTGYVQTDTGERAVGSITLATVHADQPLGRTAALQHYEDTGLVAAYGNIGEDRFGIWVAGVIKPGLPDERVTEFTASKMSGDWREVRGNLELIAVLGVNSPGFPIARVENGRPTALVAAIGPVRPTETLATAELRSTRERVVAQAARLDEIEERLTRAEARLTPVWREHLAARLT